MKFSQLLAEQSRLLVVGVVCVIYLRMILVLIVKYTPNKTLFRWKLFCFKLCMQSRAKVMIICKTVIGWKKKIHISQAFVKSSLSLLYCCLTFISHCRLTYMCCVSYDSLQRDALVRDVEVGDAMANEMSKSFCQCSSCGNYLSFVTWMNASQFDYLFIY